MTELPPNTIRLPTANPEETIAILKAALPPFVSLVVLDVCWNGLEQFVDPHLIGPPLWIVKFILLASGGYLASKKGLDLLRSALAVSVAWGATSILENLLITPFFYGAFHTDIADLVIDFVEAAIIGGIFGAIGAYISPMVPPIFVPPKKERILVTADLQSASEVPHLGNLATILPADVFSRFQKMRGKEVLFISGTREYGEDIDKKALAKTIRHEDLAAKYFLLHRELISWFGVKFDIFGRASGDFHKSNAMAVFKALKANDLISEFVDPKTAKKDLFINLAALESRYGAWLEKSSKNWNEKTADEIYLVYRKLENIPLMGDIKLGVPIDYAGYEKFYFDPSFEAPLGYITITADSTKDWKDWWQNSGTRIYQFFSRKTLKSHAITFPASLIGSGGWTTPYHLHSYENLTFKKKKLSKPERYGIFADDAKASGIPPDAWRYYLLAALSETEESDFSLKDLTNKNNLDLVPLSEMVLHIADIVIREFDKKVPASAPTESDTAFVMAQNEIAKKAAEDLENVRIREALGRVMAFSKNISNFMEKNNPEELLKKDKARAATVTAILAAQAKDLSILLNPLLPETSGKIADSFNVGKLSWGEIGNYIPSGQLVAPLKPLFSKITPDQLEKLEAKLK
jgi:methionyl-tRNA synthetase